MRVIAYIDDPKVVKKILVHLKLPAEAPVPDPPRRPAQVEMWDYLDDLAPEQAARVRAPPNQSGEDEIAWN